MHVKVDSDKTLGHETNGLLKKSFNFFFIPVLSVLPAWSKHLIHKSDSSAGEVIDHATTHVALEVLYQKGSSKPSRRTWMSGIAHRVWFNTNNSKGVRNRIRIVERELRKAIEELGRQGKRISILSIASGSARAVVESIVNARLSVEVPVSIVFLDKNPAALEYSKGLLRSHGLLDRPGYDYEWVNDTAGAFLRKTSPKRFNIVEMVGLLDYFDDNRSLALFRDIHSVLEDQGLFITANINHNPEKHFLTRVIGWKMVYRSAEELGNLLLKSGFKENNIELYYEPLKVHGIAIATIATKE